MEQESHKREVEETSYQTPNSPTLCANNCGFFGTAATNNFCSKCYKDFFLKQSKASLALVDKEIDKPIIGKVIEEDQVTNTTILNEEGASSKNPGDRPANRCSLCRKRVGLTGFKCRCNQLFCSLHRYTDKHNCVFDYKSAAQDAITKANPVVKADKIEKI